ncbi:hypothetical protein L249_3434, partial [Ophiocordyceps polyrhachis-furcata BCC 54312]
SARGVSWYTTGSMGRVRVPYGSSRQVRGFAAAPSMAGENETLEGRKYAELETAGYDEAAIVVFTMRNRGGKKKKRAEERRFRAAARPLWSKSKYRPLLGTSLLEQRSRQQQTSTEPGKLADEIQSGTHRVLEISNLHRLKTLEFSDVGRIFCLTDPIARGLSATSSTYRLTLTCFLDDEDDASLPPKKKTRLKCSASSHRPPHASQCLRGLLPILPALPPPDDEPRLLRRMSFYAGPLEGHRRVGRRRQMTSHIAEPPAFPLIWRFDVPPATNKLQWQPPTTAEYRRQRNQPSTASKLVSKLISWLKMLAGAAFSEAEADAAVPEAEAAPAQMSLPEEIALLRRIVCQSEEKIPTKRLFELCKGCQASIWVRVRRGELSLPFLGALFDPLDSETKSRIPSSVADSITIMIRNALIRAMGSVQQMDDQLISSDLWSAIAERICNAKNGVHDLFLFSRLICVMPVPLQAHISSERVAELGLVIVQALARLEQCLVPSVRLNQFVRFNEALDKLTETRRHEIHDMMRSLVLQQEDGNAERRLRLRFSWLLLRALDSHASASDIVEAYHAVMEPGTCLDSIQLWHLSAARFLVAGALPWGQKISTMPSMLMSRRWTILIRAVLPSQNYHVQLRELCSLLAGIDGFKFMARALANLPFQDMPMDALQMNLVLTVAHACDHHALALQLYQAFILQLRSKEELAAWKWTHWAKYVEGMIKDPDINPSWVWRVLGKMTYADEHDEKKKKKKKKEEEEEEEDDDDDQGAAAAACLAAAAPEALAKMKLLIKMSQWMVEASHLTDRQLLRGLTRCASYQRKLTGKVSPSTLVHLARVMLRDLQRGKRGRTSRLEWLIRLCEEQDPTDAAKTAAWLRGWRSVIPERWIYFFFVHINKNRPPGLMENGRQSALNRNKEKEKNEVTETFAGKKKTSASFTNCCF